MTEEQSESDRPAIVSQPLDIYDAFPSNTERPSAGGPARNKKPLMPWGVRGHSSAGRGRQGGKIPWCNSGETVPPAGIARTYQRPIIGQPRALAKTIVWR